VLTILTATILAVIDTDELLNYGLRTMGRSMLVIVIAAVAVRLLQHLLGPLVRVAIREQMATEPELEVEKRIKTLSDVIYRTVLIAAVVLVIVTLLPQFGVNAAPLIAGLGLVGLAVGFGAQNLVKDVINGVFILVENQYSKGDVVKVADISGLVEDINLRRTVLRDLDGTVHFIPHSQIDTASNLTKGFSRVNFNVRIAYDQDIDKVFKVINQVGEELAQDPEFMHLIKEPPHALRVDNFTDSAIEVKVLGETVPIEQWTVMGELRRRLKRAFDEEGIVIPYPYRTPGYSAPPLIMRPTDD
jgi:moderate conductance mechanosensitive channel